MLARAALVVIAFAATAGCLVEIPPMRNEQIAGTWTLTIRNGQNGCMFGDWQEGAMNLVELAVEQDPLQDARIRARVQGLAGLVFGVGFGSADLSGTIDGRQVQLVLVSENPIAAPGGCMFTPRIAASATVDSRTFRNGKLVYSPYTTSGPACAPIAGCETVQTFEGVRTADPPDAGAPKG